MKFEIFRYDLPLSKAIQFISTQINIRSGFIIRIWDENNFSGYGEVAPLPGFHNETLEAASENLQNLRSFLIDSEIPANLEELNNGFEKWFAGKNMLPSVRFGLEMAVLNLIANQNNQSLGALLSNTCQKTIALNGLISGNENEIIEQVKQLSLDGYQTIKIKVGRISVDEEIQIVSKVKKIINQRTRLRLDANRSWSILDAVRFGKAIGSDNIEYIEEPLSEINKVNSFYEQTGIPIALDESLNEIPKEIFKNMNGLKAFVIKPSLLGGFERSMEFVRFGLENNIYSVISSSFESGIGLTALANFAASINPGVAMGLNTYKWFKNDLLENGINANQGKLDLELLNKRSTSIRQDLLRKII